MYVIWNKNVNNENKTNVLATKTLQEEQLAF